MSIKKVPVAFFILFVSALWIILLNIPPPINAGINWIIINLSANQILNGIIGNGIFKIITPAKTKCLKDNSRSITKRKGKKKSKRKALRFQRKQTINEKRSASGKIYRQTIDDIKISYHRTNLMPMFLCLF